MVASAPGTTPARVASAREERDAELDGPVAVCFRLRLGRAEVVCLIKFVIGEVGGRGRRCRLRPRP